MATYQDKNEWVDNVYTVDVFTPVLGGKTAWQGEHPVSGYSNASIEQLADRTHYLKEAIETLERVVGVKTDGIMLGKNNLSELTDIMEAKYRLELNLVDNVRDLDKPVSNPTRVELNKKADKATKILGNDGLVGGGDLSTDRNIGLSQATKDSLLLANNSVQKETKVIAGNGLTGGGSLSGDVTLNLGTPSETSVTSTNSSSGASHTHALSVGVKDSLRKADEAAPLTFVNTELGKKADKIISITGVGALSGGGTLAANRTIDASAATKASLSKADSALQNGAFGLGSIGKLDYPAASLDTIVESGFYYAQTTKGFPFSPDGHVLTISYSAAWACQIAFDYRSSKTLRRSSDNGVWTEWEEFLDTRNILKSTGNSTQFPMTQKTTTDALNLKQDKLTAGTNISISGDTISATNTTYSAMSVAELRTGTATTSRVVTAKNINDFSSFVTLSGTSISPNLNSGRNFSLSLTGNTTINNPTNLRSGQTGDIAITVGSTEHTLSFGSAWKFAGGNVPETKANSITVISYKVVDASTIICGAGTEVK